VADNLDDRQRLLAVVEELVDELDGGVLVDGDADDVEEDEAGCPELLVPPAVLDEPDELLHALRAMDAATIIATPTYRPRLGCFERRHLAGWASCSRLCSRTGGETLLTSMPALPRRRRWPGKCNFPISFTGPSSHR